MLEKNKISKNPGLRSIAKLLLNTLWGRFGMNENKSKIVMVNEREKWFNMIADENYMIHEIIEAGPETLQVVCSFAEELYSGGAQTNVPIAAFVTSYARIHLFDTLITADLMKNLVQANDQSSKVRVPQRRIRIKRNGWELDNADNDKMYQFVYDKRVVHDNFQTYPDGYCL